MFGTNNAIVVKGQTIDGASPSVGIEIPGGQLYYSQDFMSDGTQWYCV
jgi:hypothetical protein